MWVLFLSLGSPVLPDARYLKMMLIASLAVYLIGLHSRPTWTTSTLALIGLQTVLLFWTIMSALANDVLVPQRIVLWSLAFFCCFALSRYGSSFLTTSFIRGGLITLSLGWILTLGGRVPGLLTSSYGWLGLQYRFSGTLTSANAVGLLSLLIVVLLIRNNEVHKYWLTLPIISILGAEYRGGIIALATCALWLGVKALQTNDSVRRLVAYIRLLVLVPVGLFVVRYLSSSRSGNGDATTGRGLIWQQCQNYIRHQSYFGGGPELIQRVVGTDTTASNSATGSFQFFHCHNQVLNDTVNFGYIGMLLSLALTVSLLLVAHRRRHIAFELLSIALLVAGLFETPLNYLGVQGDLWPVVLVWSGLLTLCQISEKHYAPHRELEVGPDVTAIPGKV